MIGTAARYENYSDFGGQGIWKLSGRYRLSESVSFLGGLATGFRAPSLHQFYFNNISTQFSGNELVEVATLNNDRAVNSFNVEPLKPEISNHISAGFVAKIGQYFTLTFNYYSIKIQDKIVLSGSFGSGFESILEPLNVDVAQFFTNAIDTRTNGFDFVGTLKAK